MKKILLTIMLVSLLALTACNITVQQAQDQANTISVGGDSEIKVVPDEATVTLNVETKGETAKTAQDQNSAIMNSMQKALKRAGLADREMETINYNIYQQRHWDPDENKQVDDGFRATHSLRIKTKDLERVGEFIQVGVDSGATSVNSVSFSLSEDGEEEARNEALRRAVDDARDKAEALADSLNVRVGKVSSVSVNSFNAYPVFRGDMAYAESAAVSAPPIAPKEVDVRANVQVVFNIA